MKWLAVSLIYIAFFALIGFAVYYTKSEWALLGLLFAPSFKTKD